jgi:hypothetical protein
VIQKVGEYIVTFADSYHMGYNSGFNIGEAVNFMFYKDISMNLEFNTDNQNQKIVSYSKNLKVNF